MEILLSYMVPLAVELALMVTCTSNADVLEGVLALWIRISSFARLTASET